MTGEDMTIGKIEDQAWGSKDLWKSKSGRWLVKNENELWDPLNSYTEVGSI
jgi:hypothetical protein